MKLDLWGFLEGEDKFVEFQGELDHGNLDLNGRKIEIPEPIKYKGEIFKVDGDKTINININIDFMYGEHCNRCLVPTINKINTILSGQLMEISEKTEVIEDEDNSYENFLYYENNTLYLNEYIIEQVILSLPMKTICKEDCKGLCSKCGIDFNNSQCDCDHDDIDPRFEKLKDFFPKK